MSLPTVTAPVLAAAVDALPNRLRRKLDDTLAAAASWPVSVHDGQSTVTVDDVTIVTLSAPDGVVTEPGQVTCTCLLAPNCLHRAAVLARAPVAAADPAAPEPDPEESGAGEALTDEQLETHPTTTLPPDTIPNLHWLIPLLLDDDVVDRAAYHLIIKSSNP